MAEAKKDCNTQAGAAAGVASSGAVDVVMTENDFDVDVHGAEQTASFVKFGNLKCTICLQLAREAHSMQCCRTTLCLLCALSSHFTRRSYAPYSLYGACPICREGACCEQDKTKQCMINAVQVRCPRQDCTWTNARMDWLKHVNGCGHRYVKCAFAEYWVAMPGVKTNVPTITANTVVAYEIAKSNTSTSATTIQNRAGCATIFKLNELKEHEPVCQWRPVTCANCQITHPFLESAHHRDTFCIGRQVPCALCKSSIKLNEMNKHTRDDCAWLRCDLGCAQVFRRDMRLNHLHQDDLVHCHIDGLLASLASKNAELASLKAPMSQSNDAKNASYLAPATPSASTSHSVEPKGETKDAKDSKDGKESKVAIPVYDSDDDDCEMNEDRDGAIVLDMDSDDESAAMCHKCGTKRVALLIKKDNSRFKGRYFWAHPQGNRCSVWQLLPTKRG
jgi:hypothetical protein